MRARILVGALVLGGCGGTGGNGSGNVVMADLLGSWTGGWHNTTFDSQGDGTMEVTRLDAEARVASVVIDLDGNVFGMTDPGPFEMTGPYDADGLLLSGTTDLIGVYQLDFDLASGVVTGMSDPGLDMVDHVDWTGTADPHEIVLDYTILDGSGAEFATGTLTFTK